MSDTEGQPPASDPWAAPGQAWGPQSTPPPVPQTPQAQPAPQADWNGQPMQAPTPTWGPPPAPPAQWGQAPQQPQWNQPTPWMGAEEPKRSTVGLIGLILAVIGLGTAFLGIFAFVSWLFTLPALVLAIIGLARRKDRNLLPAVALGTAIIAIIVSIVVFVDSAEDEFGDFFDSAMWDGAPAGATGEDGTPGLGSVDEPIAAGTPFAYDSAWYGAEATVWEVTVDGYIPLPESTWTSPGQCIAIVGGVTATSLPAGVTEAPWSDTPDAAAIAGGETQYGDETCDSSALEEQGYGHLWDATVPEGTLYLYYYDIWIPEDYAGDIQALVIGDPYYDGAAYVEALELPYPGDLEADSAANAESGVSGTATGDIGELVSTGSTFGYESWWGDGEDAFDVTVEGYIDLPLLDGTDSGECKAVLGTITPTSIASGSISDWTATPDISLVADGQTYSGYVNCDSASAEALGYGDLWDAEVPEGTEYRFYEVVMVPALVADEIDAIEVGDPTFDDVVTYVEAAPLAP